MSLALVSFLLTFLLFLLGGLPIAWSMLLAAIVWMLVSGELVFLMIVPDKIFIGIDVFILMSVSLIQLVGV